jgi:hypothetical protein
MMHLTDEIRALILNRAPSGEIRKVAVQQGMVSLRGDGWRVIRDGRTGPEEVLRATKDESVSNAMIARAMQMSESPDMVGSHS